jgi:hypothetical protein
VVNLPAWRRRLRSVVAAPGRSRLHRLEDGGLLGSPVSGSATPAHRSAAFAVSRRRAANSRCPPHCRHSAAEGAGLKERVRAQGNELRPSTQRDRCRLPVQHLPCLGRSTVDFAHRGPGRGPIDRGFILRSAARVNFNARRDCLSHRSFIPAASGSFRVSTAHEFDERAHLRRRQASRRRSATPSCSSRSAMRRDSVAFDLPLARLASPRPPCAATSAKSANALRSTVFRS